MNNRNGTAAVAAKYGQLAKDFAEALKAWDSDPSEDNRQQLELLRARIDGKLVAPASEVNSDTLAIALTDENKREETLQSLVAQLDELLNVPNSPRLTPLSEIGAPPKREWLIPDWLPRGRIGMLTAEGGFGKSRLALQVAAAMTTGGGEWLPRSVHNRIPEVAAGVVVFATWEDELAECARRIGRERAAAMQDCYIVDLACFGPLWGVEEDQHLHNRGGLLSIGKWLRERCEEVAADLLIIDSLAGAFGSNENDRAAVREFMANWDGWGRAADCAIMLISHPSQSGQRQADGYSGSTDWHGASRWRWNMATEGEGQEKRQYLALSKTNYAQVGQRVYIERGKRDKNFDWCEAADQMPTADEKCKDTKRRKRTDE